MPIRTRLIKCSRWRTITPPLIKPSQFLVLVYYICDETFVLISIYLCQNNLKKNVLDADKPTKRCLICCQDIVDNHDHYTSVYTFICIFHILKRKYNNPLFKRTIFFKCMRCVLYLRVQYYYS